MVTGGKNDTAQGGVLVWKELLDTRRAHVENKVLVLGNLCLLGLVLAPRGGHHPKILGLMVYDYYSA